VGAHTCRWTTPASPPERTRTSARRSRPRRGRRAHVHLRYSQQINAAIADRRRAWHDRAHVPGQLRVSWSPRRHDYVARDAALAADVDGYLMEFDDERSGGLRPLRFLAPGKSSCSGSSHERPELESKGRDQAPPRGGQAVSPRSSLPSRRVRLLVDERDNSLKIEEEKAKLRLIVEA